MTIKNLYPIERPVLGFNFQNSKQIDPRLTYTRATTGTFVGSNGLIQTAAVNVPRFEYNPTTGEDLGFLYEGARTNLVPYSNQYEGWAFNSSTSPASQNNQGIAPDGTNTAWWIPVGATGYNQYNHTIPADTQTYTWSVFVKALTTGAIASFGITGINNVVVSAPTFYFDTQVFNGASNGTVTKFANGWYRLTQRFTNNGSGVTFIRIISSNVDSNGKILFWGAQLEVGSTASSYIPTTSATVTRSPDQISVATTIPTTGSLFIDAKATDTTSGRTLLTAANSSNNKLLLQIQQPSNLYGSTGLVYSVNGTFKPTLPFPVPTTNRERNLITWGASNYHYRADQSRSTASNSVNVPASMNRLEIGYDSTDSTKNFTGYINSIYMWNSELQPAVAAGVVQGTITLKDADATAASIPAAALAMVFNTQGGGSTGDKNVVLPLRGSTNNIRVDWGDSTISTLIGSAANANVTHTYPSAGVYQVLITGANDGTNSNLKQLLFSGSTTPTDLYRIQQWGTPYTPTTMFQAFYGCSKLDFETAARTNLPDTSAVTDWFQAFYGCSGITGTFPTFNTAAATNLTYTWQLCSGLTSFPSITTASITNFTNTWAYCSGLTSFPLLTTSAGTNFTGTWGGCSGLTSFPLINTSAGIAFNGTWNSCSGLTSFPLINTSSATSLAGAWQGCTGLTSFPLLVTSSVTNFTAAWLYDSGLTSFPLINTSAGTNFSNTWYLCSGLTSFPSINTAAGTNFYSTWLGCSGLTSFPVLNTSAGTDFSGTWYGCSGLTSFPTLSTSAGINFNYAWYGCTGLTSFPSLNFNAATGLASEASNTYTGFRNTWSGCTNLATFPAGRFNSTTCTRYLDAFVGCALTAASIENILVSINTANTSNGNLSLQGGTNAGATTWTAPAIAAYAALVTRGWTITRNA
jgi:hypothetical protein